MAMIQKIDADTALRVEEPPAKGRKLSPGQEERLLRGLVAELRAKLRQTQRDDGVPLPTEYKGTRRLNKDAVDQNHNGDRGPRHRGLLHLRIEAVKLVQYLEKVNRRKAFKWIAKTVSGVSVAALRLTYVRYAIPIEKEYNPYAYYERRTYREVREELALRSIRLVGDYKAEDIVDSQAKYTFGCDKDMEHADWGAIMTDVRTRSGCPRCGQLASLAARLPKAVTHVTDNG